MLWLLNRYHRAFTLIEMLVTISVISLLIALLLPAVQSVRESARRLRCASQMAQIGIAVQNYASITAHFPPSCISSNEPYPYPISMTGISIRASMFTRILPQLEQASLFDSINFHCSIDEPADSPHEGTGLIGEFANSTAHSTSLQVLLCPSDGAPMPIKSAGTNIRVNEGALPDSGISTPEKLSGPSGVVFVFVRDGLTGGFRSYRSSLVSSVTDGLSNTVLMSEKLRGHEFRNPADAISRFNARRHCAMLVEWPYWRYFDSDVLVSVCQDPATTVEGVNTGLGISWMVGTLVHANYNHVSPPNPAYADCSHRVFNRPLGNFAARSQHPGGVNVGMSDGSVRFVRNGIALPVWRAIATKGGGEVIPSGEF